MAYCTGMRRGEIVSLRWQNVDLLNRLVRLNAGETKNGDGRIIPLGDELLESLKSQLHLRNTSVQTAPSFSSASSDEGKSGFEVASNRRLQEGLGQRLCQERANRTIIS